MPLGVYENYKDIDNFYEVFPTIFDDSRVVKVEANDDYTLSLWFKKNPVEKRFFDFKPLIEKYAFYKPLSDLDLFKRAYQAHGMVIWNDDLDVSAEWLYLDSDKSLDVE